MKTQYVPCIIFSVDQSSQPSITNSINRAVVERDMIAMGIDFEKVLGVYDNVEEFSYIVTSLEHTSVILGIAKEYNQDSVLLRNNENKCHLKFFDGREPLYLGYLKQVDFEEAMKSDAYTYSPKLKTYFKCIA